MSFYNRVMDALESRAAAGEVSKAQAASKGFQELLEKFDRENAPNKQAEAESEPELDDSLDIVGKMFAVLDHRAKSAKRAS